MIGLKKKLAADNAISNANSSSVNDVKDNGSSSEVVKDENLAEKNDFSGMNVESSTTTAASSSISDNAGDSNVSDGIDSSETGIGRGRGRGVSIFGVKGAKGVGGKGGRRLRPGEIRIQKGLFFYINNNNIIVYVCVDLIFLRKKS